MKSKLFVVSTSKYNNKVTVFMKSVLSCHVKFTFVMGNFEIKT